MNTDIQLTPNFHLREFLHNGSSEGLNPHIVDNLKKLAQELEGIRSLCGNRRIRITSGFRTWKHHCEIYAKHGKKPIQGSYHLKGMAADFVVEGLPPSHVQALLKNWKGGLEYAPTWTHVDTGPKRRFTI